MGWPGSGWQLQPAEIQHVLSLQGELEQLQESAQWMQREHARLATLADKRGDNGLYKAHTDAAQQADTLVDKIQDRLSSPDCNGYHRSNSLYDDHDVVPGDRQCHASQQEIDRFRMLARCLCLGQSAEALTTLVFNCLLFVGHVLHLLFAAL